MEKMPRARYDGHQATGVRALPEHIALAAPGCAPYPGSSPNPVIQSFMEVPLCKHD